MKVERNLIASEDILTFDKLFDRETLDAKPGYFWLTQARGSPHEYVPTILSSGAVGIQARSDAPSNVDNPVNPDLMGYIRGKPARDQVGEHLEHLNVRVSQYRCGVLQWVNVPTIEQHGTFDTDNLNLVIRNYLIANGYPVPPTPPIGPRSDADVNALITAALANYITNDDARLRTDDRVIQLIQNTITDAHIRSLIFTNGNALADSRIPSSIARDTEVATAVSDAINALTIAGILGTGNRIDANLLPADHITGLYFSSTEKDLYLERNDATDTIVSNAAFIKSLLSADGATFNNKRISIPRAGTGVHFLADFSQYLVNTFLNTNIERLENLLRAMLGESPTGDANYARWIALRALSNNVLTTGKIEQDAFADTSISGQILTLDSVHGDKIIHDSVGLDEVNNEIKQGLITGATVSGSTLTLARRDGADYTVDLPATSSETPTIPTVPTSEINANTAARVVGISANTDNDGKNIVIERNGTDNNLSVDISDLIPEGSGESGTPVSHSFERTLLGQHNTPFNAGGPNSGSVNTVQLPDNYDDYPFLECIWEPSTGVSAHKIISTGYLDSLTHFSGSSFNPAVNDGISFLSEFDSSTTRHYIAKTSQNQLVFTNGGTNVNRFYVYGLRDVISGGTVTGGGSESSDEIETLASLSAMNSATTGTYRVSFIIASKTESAGLPAIPSNNAVSGILRVVSTDTQKVQEFIPNHLVSDGNHAIWYRETNASTFTNNEQFSRYDIDESQVNELIQPFAQAGNDAQVPQAKIPPTRTSSAGLTFGENRLSNPVNEGTTSPVITLNNESGNEILLTFKNTSNHYHSVTIHDIDDITASASTADSQGALFVEGAFQVRAFRVGGGNQFRFRFNAVDITDYQLIRVQRSISGSVARSDQDINETSHSLRSLVNPSAAVFNSTDKGAFYVTLGTSTLGLPAGNYVVEAFARDGTNGSDHLQTAVRLNGNREKYTRINATGEWNSSNLFTEDGAWSQNLINLPITTSSHPFNSRDIIIPDSAKEFLAIFATGSSNYIISKNELIRNLPLNLIAESGSAQHIVAISNNQVTTFTLVGVPTISFFALYVR